ncbi:MAG: hypothetical protein ACYS6Z_04770 [Planctomycetota bacterium]|jgi:hypothetical protein
MRTMSFLALLAVGGAGFGIGWYTRAATYEAPVVRTPRKVTRNEQSRYLEDTAARTQALEAEQARRETKRRVEAAREGSLAPATAQPGAAVDEAATAEGEVEPDPLAEMVKSQGPQWKAWATMQAKPKILQLLAELGFDPETTARIEEAMLKDVEHQVDQAMLMMLGEADLDPNAFLYFMGLPPDLNAEVERELGTFLGDNEIASVRSEVKKAHDKQLTDFADMQIGMMQLTDMTADQKTRMREIFRGKNLMQEQFTQFAEVTRDRSLFKKLVTGEIDLAAEMKKSFEPQRQRVSQILTPEQMKGYDKYEESLIRGAEMGMKMMGAMVKEKPKPKEGE